jgi:transcriptional regulator with XRE-family HTH domain
MRASGQSLSSYSPNAWFAAEFILDKKYYYCVIILARGIMSGAQVRETRKARGLTQVQLAQKMGLSQAYMSLLERGQRHVPARLAAKLATVLEMSPTAVPVQATSPLSAEESRRHLGTLGYEGFRYLETRRRVNPAEVMLRTLRSHELDGRVARALPWLLMEYADLNWDWLLRQAKQEDLQNRLGFLVSLAKGLAVSKGKSQTVARLNKWERQLEVSRLLKTDCLSAVTQAEERWLRDHRSDEAKYWNVLSSLTPSSLDASYSA